MPDRKQILDRLGKQIEGSQFASKIFGDSLTKTKVIDVGETVFCDVCDEEYTNNNTDCGGFIFGSKAYCPKCANDRLPKIKSYGEEKYIKAYCPPGMTFKDFVLAARGGNNQIKIISQVEEKS